MCAARSLARSLAPTAVRRALPLGRESRARTGRLNCSRRVQLVTLGADTSGCSQASSAAAPRESCLPTTASSRPLGDASHRKLVLELINWRRSNQECGGATTAAAEETRRGDSRVSGAAMPALTLALALALVLAVPAGASEFPERECCDSIPPLPAQFTTPPVSAGTNSPRAASSTQSSTGRPTGPCNAQRPGHPQPPLPRLPCCYCYYVYYIPWVELF